MNLPRSRSSGFIKIIVLFCIILITGCSKQNNSTHQDTTSGKKYSVNPGTVANVFGWGYNRTSCVTPDKKDTVIFFYAEDQHLYYAFASDPSKYFSSHEVPQNPDFDVVCTETGIHISFSDPNQQKMFYTKGKWYENTLNFQTPELVFDGYRPYSAVAPHLQETMDGLYIAFMEYGSPDQNQDSKAYVSQKIQDQDWFTQEVYHSSAKNTAVLGISLEVVKGELIAMIAPNPEGMYFFKFYPKNNRWSLAKRIELLEPRGHLEWLTLTDAEENLHMVYRNEKQALGYLYFDGETYSFSSIEGLAVNAFSIFKTATDDIYLIYNSGKMRRIIENRVSKAVDLSTEFNSNGDLHFLRIPENINDSIDLAWAIEKSGNYIINYKRINLSQYSNAPEFNEIDQNVEFFQQERKE